MVNQPTTDQVEERLEVVSENLRSVMFSMATVNLGCEVAKAHGLSESDTSFLSQVIGWVLMGFVHSSVAAEAIAEYVGIDLETAKAVAQDLNEKLFKKYAAELDKIYAPRGAAPAKLMDISAAAPTPTTSAPAPTVAPASMPKGPAPATLPATPTLPVPGKNTESTPKPWQPTKLSVPGAPPTGPSTPTLPTAQAAPAPFMMHEESSASPFTAGTGFKLNVPASMFKSQQSSKMDIPRPPVKPANLEIGKAPLLPKTPASASFQTSSSTPARVIHYTDLRTAVSPGLGMVQPPPISKPVPAAVPPMPPAAAAPKPVSPIPPNFPAPAPIKLPTTPAMPSKPPGAEPPTLPMPPKAAKVVNFGPEEVK